MSIKEACRAIEGTEKEGHFYDVKQTHVLCKFDDFVNKVNKKVNK